MALDLEGSHCINIGTGYETSINVIFHLLKDLNGSALEEVHGPAKMGEQQRSVIAPRLALDRMGWRPQVSIKDGLALTVEYFRDRLEKQ